MCTTNSPRYRLARHVHACRSGHFIVLLDLRHDRYLGLQPEALPVLRHRVSGIDAMFPDGRKNASMDDAQLTSEGVVALEQLISGGILVPTDAIEGSETKVPIEPPVEGLSDEYEPLEVSVRVRDVVRFLYAVAYASFLLRYRPLEETLESVRRISRGADTFQAAKAKRLMNLFDRLRTLAYTAHNKCLFNSLAAKRFLAFYGIHPRFVMGVATDPFKAHCWLQRGTIVVNDRSYLVQEYSPILAI